jgi:hypothetical protein
VAAEAERAIHGNLPGLRGQHRQDLFQQHGAMLTNRRAASGSALFAHDDAFPKTQKAFDAAKASY